MNYWKTFIKSLAIGICVFGVTGCAGTPPVKIQPVSPTMQSINKSASQIHSELQRLREIRQQQNQKLLSTIHITGSPIDTKLNKKISFRWAGPILPAVKKLTKMIGYTFEVTGAEPVNSPLINLDTRNQTIFSVFEDIGWQAGKNIGVVVDQSKQVVKVFFVGGKN